MIKICSFKELTTGCITFDKLQALLLQVLTENQSIITLFPKDHGHVNGLGILYFKGVISFVNFIDLDSIKYKSSDIF